MFLRQRQTLNIRHWIATFYCIQIRKAKNLTTKINLPDTSTTRTRPSLTSYYWTQSLRHSWGGSVYFGFNICCRFLWEKQVGTNFLNLLLPRTLAPNQNYQQMLLKLLDIRLTRTPPGAESSRALWLGYVWHILNPTREHSKTGAEVG